MNTRADNTRVVESDAGHPPLLLFDGVCHLCSGVVRFVIEREDPAHIMFASLQSELGRDLSGVDADALDTMVFIDNGRYYRKSTGALRILGRLGFPWRIAQVCLVIPRPLRDAVYDFIGSRRYRWFGRSEQCWIPTPELGRRFLENVSDVTAQDLAALREAARGHHEREGVRRAREAE